MDEAIDGRDSHGLIREYLIPCAERLICGDCDTFVFISTRNQLEQYAGLSLILVGVCDIIKDDQIELVEFGRAMHPNILVSAPMHKVYKRSCAVLGFAYWPRELVFYNTQSPRPPKSWQQKSVSHLSELIHIPATARPSNRSILRLPMAKALQLATARVA